MLVYQFSFGCDKSLIRVSSAWFRALFRFIILLNWGSTGANRVAMVYCRGAPRIDFIYIGEFSHLCSSARCHHYPTTYMLPLRRVKAKTSFFTFDSLQSPTPHPDEKTSSKYSLYFILILRVPQIAIDATIFFEGTSCRLSSTWCVNS